MTMKERAMSSPSLANDPMPTPQPEVLFHVLWAVGQPGSGWEHFPSFVTAFNCEFVERFPLEYDEQRKAAERSFTQHADVDDALFFVAPMTCSLPVLPA
jgi:hypothetical protein